MFKIISPDGQKFHQPAIEALLDLLKVYQNSPLSAGRKKRATFIVAEDNKLGVYGGAVLYSQQVCKTTKSVSQDMYEDTFRSAFVTFQPQEKKFWRAKICFCKEANHSNLEEMERCERFYRDLYECLLAFGNSKKIEFLTFSLCSFDTVEPPLYKKWPRCIPVQRSDATDGLSHGILPFTGKKFIPQKSRKPLLGNIPPDQHEIKAVHQGRAH